MAKPIAFPDDLKWEKDDYRALLKEAVSGHFRPEDFLAFSYNESGLSNVKPLPFVRRGLGPWAWNKDGDAKGLTQMMPRTLANLGWKPGDPDYDRAAGDYNKAPIPVQLSWARRYFDYWRRTARLDFWPSSGVMYLANFYPAHLSFAGDPSHVLVDSKKAPSVYLVNRGLDTGAKGFINVLDMQIHAAKGVGSKLYQAAVRSLNAQRQWALNIRGADLVEDGLPGPLTRAATAAFQRKKGLPSDGAFGPVTDRALFA